MLKQISELIENIPNDKELGKEIRKRRNLIKLQLFVEKNHLNKSYQVSDNYFKIGCYEKVEGELSIMLLEYGYTEKYDDCDELGRLYYYTKNK